MLGVSESGYYAWRDRPPSQRAIRHAWLTEQIREIHSASRGTYGHRRVQAELTLGRGIAVGHWQVELVMRPRRHRWVLGPPQVEARTEAGDRGRPGGATSPARIPTAWVTDITEHPTRQGKVYCAAVLDTFSRLVVGWSIDSSATAALVTSALGMAIDRRDPDGTVIHSDQGVQAVVKRSCYTSI